MTKIRKNNLVLYKTIFKRKSVRLYDMTPLSDDVLVEIADYIAQLDTIFKGKDIEARIVSGDLVKTGMQKPAPHYVAIFSEKIKENLLDIGFMFQQLSLYLTSRGLGSCWLGIPNPTTELIESSKNEFVIFLSFGIAKESLHRKNIAQFNRKSIDIITDIEGIDELMESARLAPSAVNNQPWFFTGNKDIIHVHCNKMGAIRGLMLKKYNMMDIGIGICHLWLAAKNSGSEVVFITENSEQQKSKSGYNYVISLKLNKIN